MDGDCAEACHVFISASLNHRALAFYTVLLSSHGPSCFIFKPMENDKRLILIVGPQLKRTSCCVFNDLHNYLSQLSCSSTSSGVFILNASIDCSRLCYILLSLQNIHTSQYFCYVSHHFASLTMKQALLHNLLFTHESALSLLSPFEPDEPTVTQKPA